MGQKSVKIGSNIPHLGNKIQNLNKWKKQGLGSQAESLATIYGLRNGGYLEVFNSQHTKLQNTVINADLLFCAMDWHNKSTKGSSGVATVLEIREIGEKSGQIKKSSEKRQGIRGKRAKSGNFERLI